MIEDKFNNLELIKEYKNFLSEKWDFRVYRSFENSNGIYYFHFGFPEKIVKPLCPILECSPYWGTTHWKEIDGFWLWFSCYTSKNKIPEKEKLTQWLKFFLNHYNMCFRFCSK